MPLSAIIADEDPEVKVDHGFMAAIVDDSVQTPLFLTSVLNAMQTSTKFESVAQTAKSDASSAIFRNSNNFYYSLWTMFFNLIFFFLSGSLTPTFVANHGFVGMIPDKQTGNVIFLTAVDNPTIVETRYRSLTGENEILSSGTGTTSFSLVSLLAFLVGRYLIH
ncbi:unnamed protein product [Orchesella dallaii]|uniref:Uncharacterized protein n=1 Tax=Orchesella dallaii TaxID=48710 RepID=A0ABP1S4F6_9HEXA